MTSERIGGSCEQMGVHCILAQRTLRVCRCSWTKLGVYVSGSGCCSPQKRLPLRISSSGAARRTSVNKGHTVGDVT